MFFTLYALLCIDLLYNGPKITFWGCNKIYGKVQEVRPP